MHNALSTLLLTLLPIAAMAAMVSSAAVEDPLAQQPETPVPLATRENTSPIHPIRIKGCVENVEDLPYEDLWFLNQGDERLLAETLIIVNKAERKTMLFSGGTLIYDEETGLPACWNIALGVNKQGEHPVGAKTRRGDRKTPEGWYRTSDKPWSDYYGAIYVHYPNRFDARRGLDAELIDEAQYQSIIQADARGARPFINTRLGGDILLHGGGSWNDWTWGCIGFNNSDIDELRALLPADMRTTILIVP